MPDPATVAAGTKAVIDVASVAFDSSNGCCTSPWFRISCTKGGGTAYCSDCKYYYCRYHHPKNNGGIQGGHVCK